MCESLRYANSTVVKIDLRLIVIVIRFNQKRYYRQRAHANVFTDHNLQ